MKDKATKIPDKEKSIDQPANNVYFLEKIKGHPVKNIFYKQIFECYFKEHSQNFCSIIQLERQYDQSPKVF